MKDEAIIFTFIHPDTYEGYLRCSYSSYITLRKFGKYPDKKYDIDGYYERMPKQKIDLLIIIEAIEDLIEKGYTNIEIYTTKYLERICNMLLSKCNSNKVSLTPFYDLNEDLIEKLKLLLTNKRNNINVLGVFDHDDFINNYTYCNVL